MRKQLLARAQGNVLEVAVGTGMSFADYRADKVSSQMLFAIRCMPFDVNCNLCRLST